MAKKKPVLIEEILKKTIGEIEKNNKHRATEEELLKAWEEAAGKQAAKHTKIKQLVKNRLIINVDSPTWIYQLNLNKESIESKLNTYLGRPPAIKIIFRAGDS